MPSQRLSQTAQKLDFGEKLLQTGKKENSDALLRRLKTLHQKLATLEQDFTDLRSLEPIRKPLIDRTIFFHKDRGVKAYAACCLADLLRIYAPDAPYTETELRDIFQFFSAQLNLNLRTSSVKPLQPSRTKSNDASQSQTQGAASQRITDVAYYTEYCYLLESLATIKSIVLACDVPDGEGLVTSFFTAFLDLVRPDMSKNLIRHLVNILSALLEESASIPQGVMDCIIEQFSKFGSQPETPSFQLIKDVCNATSDKLQRPILAHFSEIQIQHGRNPTTDDIRDLAESHKLILTMYRHAPGLLMNVVPVLEENLKAADEIPLRQLSTRTLGRMFGERPVVGGGTADLARAYPATWRAWTGRRLDKATPVRLAWVEASKGILTNHPEIRKELEKLLVDRIEDSNEQVRAAICKVFGSMDYETTLHHIDADSLKAVGDRMSDKKGSVRAEATEAMAKLWNAAYSQLETNNVEAVTHFGWIPQAMLSCLTKEVSPDTRQQISAVVKDSILPLPSQGDDNQAWIDRLLSVASHLDENAFKALEMVTGLRGYAKGSSPYRAFIEFCEANNGGVIDHDEEIIKSRLSYIIDAMANQLFVDPASAKTDLEAFADINEPRLYKLFKACADPQSDLKTILQSRNEFIRRIEQHHTDILPTFSALLNNASFSILNQSAIPLLLKILQKPGGGLMKNARVSAASRLLALIAKECAPMYRSHVAELTISMGDRKHDLLAEAALRALSALAKVERASCPNDERFIEQAIRMAEKGTPKQGKYAARIIALRAKEADTQELLETVVENLSVKKKDSLLTQLSVLTELARSAPAVFETKADEIHKFVMKQVVFALSPSSEDDKLNQWLEDDQLEILDRAKVISLRLITNRALAFARSDEAPEVAQPVLDLLRRIIRDDGQISNESMEGGHAMVHLRLRAASCLLKLANVKVLDKAMTNVFEPLTYLFQDPCFQVRQHLLRKLGEHLPPQRLLPRWNLIPAMLATDPSRENTLLARSIALSVLQTCNGFEPQDRIDRVEMPLARLVFVLSRHPEMQDWSSEVMKQLARIIEFFLDCVANRDNIGLLYYIASRVKVVKGVFRPGETATQREEDESPEEEDDDLSEERKEAKAEERALEMAKAMEEHDIAMWKLSELAQIIIRNRAEAQHWPMATYSGKARIPSDIFHNFSNSEAATKNSRTTYLTDEEVSWAKSLGRKANAVAGPSAPRRIAEASSPSTKKRSKKPKGSARKKPRKSNESVDDKTEEEDDESDLSELSEGEGEEEVDDEESEDENDGEEVIGRGGKRGAKTKAKKGLKGRKSKTKR